MLQHAVVVRISAATPRSRVQQAASNAATIGEREQVYLLSVGYVISSTRQQISR